MRGLLVMSEAECRDALEMMTVGRAGVTTDDGPYVVPVNYSVVGECIYFRARPTTVLGSHVDGAPMAFEVDRIGQRDRTGWSVLVRGRGRVVDDPAEIGLIDEVGGPAPWAWKPDRILYALDMKELTGRRMWEPDS